METYRINQTIYTGRPTDGTERQEKEMRAYDLLDSLNVPYVRVDHDALPTIEACKEVDTLLDVKICKNLFLRNAQKTDFYLLLMPGTKKFKTALLSKQIGSARLSFAEAEYMEEFLNITPGSVSVLGLMNDTKSRVRLLIDKEILESPMFGCHPCVNTSSIRLETKELTEKVIPAMKHTYTVVELPYLE